LNFKNLFTPTRFTWQHPFR